MVLLLMVGLGSIRADLPDSSNNGIISNPADLEQSNHRYIEPNRGGRGQPTFHLDVLLKNFFVLNEAFQTQLNALRLDGRSFETIDRRQKNSSSRRTSKLHLWLPSVPAAGLDASMVAFL